MTFLLLNGVTTADVRLNDAEVGIWLEQVVSRQLDFQTFVERLHKRIGSQ